MGLDLRIVHVQPNDPENQSSHLYISARDGNTDGVVGIDSKVQQKHGIHIKEVTDGGTYRRHTPGASWCKSNLHM